MKSVHKKIGLFIINNDDYDDIDVNKNMKKLFNRVKKEVPLGVLNQVDVVCKINVTERIDAIIWRLLFNKLLVECRMGENEIV